MKILFGNLCILYSSPNCQYVSYLLQVDLKIQFLNAQLEGIERGRPLLQLVCLLLAREEQHMRGHWPHEPATILLWQLLSNIVLADK